MTKSNSKIWGGRFSSATNQLMEEFNSSIDFDKILYIEDIEGSIAHSEMLAKQKIISKNDLELILSGLKQIKLEISNNEFNFLLELEDIHMNIENRLIEIIGEAGKKLHTARSRNDQVATDIKLWLRKRIDPRRVNGGVFLGLNGTVVKSHGSADATGVAAAIKLAVQLAENNFSKKIAARVASANTMQQN